MDARALELRDRFFTLLDENASSPYLWRHVWRLFVEHPWYQEELRQATLRLLRRRGAPLRWAEDIAQEAMLLLGEHLRKAAHLDVDRARAMHHFSGWLGRIIARDCQRALRSMRRSEKRAGIQGRSYEATQANATRSDKMIELAIAIDELPEECRGIVNLRLQGWRLDEIAARLNISYWAVNRALRCALSQVTEML
jgi:RNA polymerase sigma factor (sigma-70 family)